MNCTTSALVSVLLILILDLWHCETTAELTCDQLPKVDFLSNEILVANSPLQHDFALSPLFDCTTKVVTRPPRGATGYNGTSISISSSTVIILDYTVKSKTTAEVTICDTGEKSVWYSAASQSGDNGAFFCVYTCNGTSLTEFICSSNNNGASPAELDAVNLARQVPNGHLIHNARENCPARKGCNVF